jgi:hypothetical protein
MDIDVSNELPPDLNTTLDNLKKEIFSTMNCIQIGKINSIKSDEGTVEVELQIKRLAVDGTSTTIPVLTDCPYFVLQGGGAYIDMPITAGDYCIVLFNDRDIDNWWSTGNQSTPNTNRKHHLSDGLALIGITPKQNALEMNGSTIGIRGVNKKINIDNNSEKFDTWISDFIDAIVAIKTFGSPATHSLEPSTIQALNTLKTRALNLFGGS